MKLYIAVLDEFPDYMVPTLVAHSVLGAHILWQSDVMYKEWLDTSFKKCVVRVNQKEFNKIVSLSDVYQGHESTVLAGTKSCAVIKPREEYPNVLKFARLWKPKEIFA